LSLENGTIYLKEYLTDIRWRNFYEKFISNFDKILIFRTNAIEEYTAVVTEDWESGTMSFDYGNSRSNSAHYITGDIVNYIVFYDCVSCNDYGDQGSESTTNRFDMKVLNFWIFQFISTFIQECKVRLAQLLKNWKTICQPSTWRFPKFHQLAKKDVTMDKMLIFLEFLKINVWLKLRILWSSWKWIIF
jgi:hypothetical protein